MKKVFIGLVVLMAFGCNSDVDYSAKEINWDRDICINCLMGLAEQEYSVQTINSHEQVLWYDDIGCLVEYMKSEDWARFKGEGNVKVWIGHCDDGGWIDAETAYYRYGDRTPMGFGYGAVREMNDSTYDYNTMLQRIRDGYTMREGFLKEKKMLDK